MNFDIAVNGRPLAVAIDEAATPGRFTAIVGGRTRTVDVAWSDSGTLSLIEDGIAHEVRVHQRKDGVLDITIGRQSFVAVMSRTNNGTLADRRADLTTQDVRRAGLATQDPPYSAIKAPMAGRVVRVLVATGGAVVARQPVVIVEAMKMENELRSPGTGIVKEIHVQEGDAIDKGATLVVIEHAASV